MYNLQGDGVAINSPVYNYEPYNSGLPGVGANHINISDNIIYAPNSTITNRGFCISIAGGIMVTIVNNSLHDCKWQGIHIEDQSYQVTVTGNAIDHIIGQEADDESQWDGGMAGIWVSGSTEVYVLNNNISNTVNQGIALIYAASAGENAYNKVCALAGNNINLAGNYGIQAGGPNGVNVDFYIGPIPDQDLAGNTVTNSGAAPYIMYGSPTGVTVTGNSWQ